MELNLSKLQVARKTGEEAFYADKEERGLDLISFWQ
jgi:hypothetical protein